MHESQVESLDNTRLHICHNNQRGRPAIVFIHGACASHRIWQYQLQDPSLNKHFHLIALDMRGHGRSDKPSAANCYTDSKPWADDLAAVLAAMTDKPALLVAWSYGGRMVNDYIKHYGTAQVAGVNFIAAGTLARDDVKGPGYEVLGNLFSANDEMVTSAQRQFVNDLMQDVTDTAFASGLHQDIDHTPRYVRDAMRQRDMDYDTMLSSLDRPVLITHGEQDRYSLVKLAYLLHAHIPLSSLSLYEHAGHLPFIQDSARFNLELNAFTQENQTGR